MALSPIISAWLDRARSARHDGEPAWLTARRDAALETFASLGFPSRKVEDWKYTPVRHIAREVMGPAPRIAESESLRPMLADAIGDAPGARIVLVNGYFDEHLSDLDSIQDGVTVMPWREALEQRADDVQSVLDVSPGFVDAFAALSAATVTDGVFIDVAKGTEVSDPIHVVQLSSTSAGHGWMTSCATAIRVATHARVTITQSYAGDGAAAYFNNVSTYVDVADEGALELIKLQIEGADASHIATGQVRQGRASRVQSFAFTTGGRLSRDTFGMELDGEGIDNMLSALYVARGKQTMDHHTTVDHKVPHCESDQLYKGILDDAGHGIFNGKVFVRQDAQKTAAEQLNKNLLLSDQARIDTKPQLEIFADDVTCAHGATIGQLDPQEMFYLQSRAIPPDTARQLLIRGFGEDVFQRIERQDVREHLLGIFRRGLESVDA